MYVTATGAEITIETRLSHAVGPDGRIIIAGHDLFEAAQRMPYEAVAALLWREILPNEMTPGALGAARVAAFSRFAQLFPAAASQSLSLIERQRLLLSGIPRVDMSPLMLVASVGVAAAAATRLASGLEPLRPDPVASHAADLLRTARGREASRAEERAVNTYLGVMIDHGINASTFAARVTASTGAGSAASAIAGLCALEGTRHGGAPGLVLDMFDTAAGDPQAWLAAALDRRERLMGFGSRAYEGRDPRASIFKAAVETLPVECRGRLLIAEQLEAAAEALFISRRPKRALHPNVEFYAAVLLDAVGLPRTAFTSFFAAARSAGWAAHIVEQERHGRMLRPSTRYCGPGPGDS